MTILQLDNVTLHYPGNNKPVLKQLNYHMQAGDFVILLGSNGSGKSSLLKLLHRHHEANAGDIHFLGKPLHHYPAHEFSQQVGVLTQNTADSLFTSLTLYENYLLMKQQKNLALTKHTLERQFLQEYLLDFNPNLSDKVDDTVMQLSGGERQALALAFCLLHPPALLLLDEHTSALDPKTSEQIMQLTHNKILEHRISCMLTTHDLDIALRYGNRIVMLHEGKIHKTFDQAAKLSLSRHQLIESYY